MFNCYADLTEAHNNEPEFESAAKEFGADDQDLAPNAWGRVARSAAVVILGMSVRLTDASCWIVRYNPPRGYDGIRLVYWCNSILRVKSCIRILRDFGAPITMETM